MASYLLTKGVTSFSRSDIRRLFREAGEPEPRNFARDFAWAIRNGWLAGTDSAGFYITQSGRLAVERRFAAEVVKKTRGKSTSRRRRNAFNALTPFGRNA